MKAILAVIALSGAGLTLVSCAEPAPSETDTATPENAIGADQLDAVTTCWAVNEAVANFYSAEAERVVQPQNKEDFAMRADDARSQTQEFENLALGIVDGLGMTPDEIDEHSDTIRTQVERLADGRSPSEYQAELIRLSYECGVDFLGGE